MKQTTRTAKSPGAASKKKAPESPGKKPARPESPGSHGRHPHGPESPGPRNPIPEMPGKPGRDVPEIPGKPAPDGPFPGGERPEGDEMIFRGSQDDVEGARRTPDGEPLPARSQR